MIIICVRIPQFLLQTVMFYEGRGLPKIAKGKEDLRGLREGNK
jgi:hypothetical protein